MSTKPRFSAIVVSLFVLTLFSHPSYAEDKGEKLYTETFQLYKSLAANHEKISNKEIWETIARAFYSIYINYPQSDKAPNSLFISGKMYEEMGARDLGFLLSCNRDFAMFEGLAPELRFTRTQTLMEGADFCDFRYSR